MKLSHYYQRLSHTVLLTATLTITSALSEQAYASKIQPFSHGSQHTVAYSSNYSQGQLAQVLAPIALYPDVLLSHILIASTYPDDIVEATDWLNRNRHESTYNQKQKLQYKHWDDSVKALIQFPDVLYQLSNNLHWTENLSNAFLHSEKQVLNSIQLLRKQANKAGSLAKLHYLRVNKYNGIITISIPSSNQVRLPFYDPKKVYGKWHWRNHQPVRFHKTKHFSRHKGPFYWTKQTYVGGYGFFSAFNWLNHHVVIYHDRRSFNHHKGYHHKKSYHNSYHWKKKRSFKTSYKALKKVRSKEFARYNRNSDRKRYQESYNQQHRQLSNRQVNNRQQSNRHISNNRHTSNTSRSYEPKQYGSRNATIKKSPKFIKQTQVKYKNKDKRQQIVKRSHQGR